MKTKSLFIAALAVAALSACSNEEEPYVNGGSPVFTGVIDGVKTRAVDSEWQANNTIGITAGDGAIHFNVPYMVSGKGGSSFSPKNSEKFVSFTSSKPETFTAYFPYSSKMASAKSSLYIPDEDDATSTVATDSIHQGENVDFLWSSAVGSQGNPNVGFVFKHVMSEITLKFKKGDVSSLKGLKFTLGGLTLKGNFDVLTGETNLADGSSAENVTLAVGSDVTDASTEASKTAIFFPQNVSSIDLTVTVGSSSYSAVLALPEATNKQLLAGYNVEFEITVNKNALKTDNGSIIGWNTQSGSYATTFGHEAKDAKLYDLAMSDGTFITVWDTKNSTVDLSGLTQTQLDNVVGVVYYTGDLTGKDINDKVLQSEHSNCTHGFILALKNMSESRVMWMDDSDFTSSVNGEIGKVDSKFKPSSYEQIIVSYDSEDNEIVTLSADHALGYNNTRLLRAYNYYYADYKYKVRPIEPLDLFAASNESPKGSSGWYLPSLKELVLLQGNDEVEYEKNGDASEKFMAVKSVLNGLKTVGVDAAEVSGDYWSSTECGYSYYDTDCETYVLFRAWTVGFSYNRYGYAYAGGRKNTNNLRAVCAF
jgi:hypothetical protein